MRLLIVDDEPIALASYRRCLAEFDTTLCATGDAAEAAVRAAVVRERRFAVAFVDPASGTVEARLRAIDPALALVHVAKSAKGVSTDALFLRKPLDEAEIVAAARALGARWRAARARNAENADLAARLAMLEDENIELAANARRAIHTANHDALTDAPNRLAFRRALNARAREQGAFAVAMLDLDRFKFVNDTLGHLAGDALIREVCAILQREVPKGGMVARLGGDEFGLMFDVADEAAALAAGTALVGACARSFTVFGHAVQTAASAGIVVATTERREPGGLMHCADQALNDAKRSGRGLARLFAESLDESMRFRRAIEQGLRAAIANDELTLVFQPIVARERLEVVGFEALLRWKSAAHGDIPPATFIPVAEESNLIHELGDWAMRRALMTLADWPGQYVSLNVSARQFRRQDFADHVAGIVGQSGIDPARLQIEITESAIFDEPSRAASTLARLRAAGLRVALDDFGSGYSSLNSIRDLPLDSLKIDRSFVDGMGRERQSAAIVHSIIHLGRALGLNVIAEGVESEVQAQALRLAGASHLQGYFFAGPVEAEAAGELARARYIAEGAVLSAASQNGTSCLGQRRTWY